MMIADDPRPCEDLRQTCLHALHQELGARFVPFAGYKMPVQYATGIKREHLHTRAQAGFFDISHMGQFRLRGSHAAAALEALVPGDITGLRPWRQRYTLLTNADGGVEDDIMVSCVRDGLFVVVNAARKSHDERLLRRITGDLVALETLPAQALLALQGPAAVAVLRRIFPGVESMRFMEAGEFRFGAGTCLLHRCGYTGEDGFEISIDGARAEELARQLLASTDVLPVGLGARDSLRLEAGLCLYGQDLDSATSPIEAGLSWVVAGKYRAGGSGRADFPGAARILAQLADGTNRRRVGLQPEGRAPVRAGTIISDSHGQQVGRVTSGGFGPSVEKPIAMGYVLTDYSTPGARLQVEIRGRSHPVRVVNLPFIETRYRKD